MRLRRLARALVGVGLLAVVAPAPAAAPFEAALDRELAAVVDDADHPLASLAALAIRDGEVVYARGFGRRTLAIDGKGADRPATPATLFRIASVSKLVTTLVVMKAVEDGHVDLDADVSRTLGWTLRNPHFPDAPITLRQLLTHTSSLRDEGGYSWDATVALRDVLQPGGALSGSGAMWDREHAPGTWFSYANLPWGVIATVLERATGERFDRLARRTVLVPLGVPGGYNPAEFSRDELANLATLYRKREAVGQERWNTQGPWVPQVDDYEGAPPVSRAGPGYVVGTNGTLMGPQGGLRTSVQGLARVMRMLMGRGELDGKRVFKAASIDEMLREQWRYDGRNGGSGYGAHPDRFNAWGLGNQRFTDLGGANRGDRIVAGFTGHGHLGDAWGLTSLFAFDPRTRNGMIFLVGGTAIDPETRPGRDSSLYRYEERIAASLWRRAVQGRAD